jgi:hypothetical protein
MERTDYYGPSVIPRKMIEFGSDFHYIDNYGNGNTHLTDLFRDTTLLADGRQCIVLLIRQYGWKRIWFPDYYCYEVIDTIREQTDIEVTFYEDNPLHEGDVYNLPCAQGDVLLRMNFFGLRGWRSSKGISCPVIEDHSHDPLGEWALNSDAGWCISSIRKTLPLSEGGMMWSPKGYQLTDTVDVQVGNEQMAAIRWNAMEMKAAYLKGYDESKEAFRTLFTKTERWFDRAEPTWIDDRSRDVVSIKLDINLWKEVRRRNWSLLNSLVNREVCSVLEPQNENCTAFSFVLVFDDRERRDSVRARLIEAGVYPAVLWVIPDSASEQAKDFSNRMLSIHCDGRYNQEDIRQLEAILNKALGTR